MARASLTIARNSRRLVSSLDLIFSRSALPSGAAGAPLPILVDLDQAPSRRSRSRSKSEQDQLTCSAPVRRQEAQTPGQAPTTRTDHQPSKSPSVKPAKDIRVAEFRAALQKAEFTYLKHVGRFVDRRYPSSHRMFLPDIDARGRMHRRETLVALEAWRAKHEATLAAIAAQQHRRIALAERLAPQVVPGCRADLKEAAAIAQLADDFLNRTAGYGSIDFKSLIQMGWSAVQVREHGDAARTLADRKASSTLPPPVASNRHA